jgi:hypothetical protein
MQSQGGNPVNYDEGFIIAKDDEEYPVGINDAPLTPEEEEEELYWDNLEHEEYEQDLVDDTEEEQ